MRRPAPPRDVPPPLELLCLRALWTLGEGNTTDVRRVVGEAKPLAYTTVMTLLERLAKKGMATRRKQGRAFVYAPQVSRDSMRRAALRELLDALFDGREERLRAFLEEVPPATAVRAAQAAERLDASLL